MATKNYRTCDHCNTITEDHMEHKGWITLQTVTYDDFTFRYSKGRKPSREASSIIKTYKQLDFCRFECMVEYFKKEIGNK